MNDTTLKLAEAMGLVPKKIQPGNVWPQGYSVNLLSSARAGGITLCKLWYWPPEGERGPKEPSYDYLGEFGGPGANPLEVLDLALEAAWAHVLTLAGVKSHAEVVEMAPAILGEGVME